MPYINVVGTPAGYWLVSISVFLSCFDASIKISDRLHVHL